MITRGGMKAPIATDWVTVADISGTGTAIVESGNIDVVFDGLPSFINAHVEVQYTQAVVAGAGLSHVWASFYFSAIATTATDSATPTPTYTSITLGASAINRRVIIIPQVLQQATAVSATDRFRLRVRARGSDVATQWTATNIRARLIYTPL